MQGQGDVGNEQESLLERWRHRYQEREVVIEEVATGRQVTAGELFDAALARAATCASVGVASGDRVGLVIADPVELITWHLGVLALGAVSVPLDAHAPAPDTRARLEEAAPALVVSEGDMMGRWRSLAPGDADRRHAATVASSGTWSSPALMLFTSGTTGRPKGVPLSAANLVATARSVVEAWGWAPEDRLILALPLYHMHGLGVGVHGSLEAGARMLVLPRFDPGAVLAQAARASMLFGVPTMYHRLLAHPEVGALGRLRLLVSGSAPLPEATFRELESATGHQVLERYGMSETGMIASNPLAGERRPGTVGRALPGMEIRLAGGPESEIEVRGRGVFGGYWQRPDADREAFTRDGWFRTGDLGRYDEAGYLVICGRAKELIISGGHNVWPREVEEVIEAMAGVREAAVVGATDPEWGELVVAHVVVEGEVTTEAIVDWCRARLAHYKVPRKVVFASELPRNHMGKLQRHQLA